MEEAAHQVHDEAAALDPAGEEGWGQLRRQFDLADGFWLGFVFCPSPRTAAVLRRRAEHILRFRAQRIRVIQPVSPEELSSVLHILFESESAHASCVWLESIHSDPPILREGAAGPWTLAWDNFLLRANEHREGMRRHFPGGLILVAPPETKPRARDAAPDLWSIRSLVLDLQPISESSINRIERDGFDTGETRNSVRGVSFDLSSKVGFSSAEAERIARKIENGESYHPHGLARIRLLEVESLLKRGRTHEAADVARKTVDLLRKRPDAERLLAEALVRSSEAALVDGDIAVSLEHSEAAVKIRRNILIADGEMPRSLRDLSISLDRVGDVRRAAGELASATVAHEESLALVRRLVDAYGETPESLRDLSISLNKVGDVCGAAGELASATAAYEESLALGRRLVDAYGETPESLRDLSISLNKVGDVRGAAGELASATAAYEESLALRRRLVDAYGETPQSLRDLSVSLDRVGDVRGAAGELASATAAHEESLALCRRLVDAYGETPESLRDLSISLNKVGDVRGAAGELASATAAHEESLALRRRLVDAYGETPQSLRDLSISLNKVGDVRREIGE